MEIDNQVDEYLHYIKKNDQQIITIFTKSDKLKQNELAKLKQKYPHSIFVSNLKKRGIEQANQTIYNILFGKTYENI